MFLPLDLMLGYCIEHVTIGSFVSNLYPQLGYSKKKIQGFFLVVIGAVDEPLASVSPVFGKLIFKYQLVCKFDFCCLQISSARFLGFVQALCDKFG